MDATTQFLLDLTVALAGAAVGGWVATRLHLNAIVGYLVVGIIIGPFTPGYVAHGTMLESLAELGLIFLLFSLGLGFSFAELRSIGPLPLAASLAAMAVLVVLFEAGAAAFGAVHPWTLGLASAVSSTAIGVALLRGWGFEHHRIGHFVLALLIVQDLAAVVLLVVAASPAPSAAGLIVPIAKALGFVLVALALGATLLPWLVARLLQRAPTEALFGAFAAFAMVAASLAHTAGLSFDFGAFVAGAVISEAASTRMAQAIVAPFRALFVALFFVAMGMLLDPAVLAQLWVPSLVLGIAFMLVRLGLWAAVARLAGFAAPAALLMGAAMVPLGEFNIVLDNAAASAGRLTATERSLLLGITFFSILVAALGAPALRPLRDRALAGRPGALDGERHDGALVAIVGFGRVGQTVAETLARCEIPYAVLESDRDVVAAARRRGVAAIAGDGNDPEALDRLVAPGTRVIVAATSDSDTNAAIAQRFETRANVRVIARASRRADVAGLLGRGAVQALVPETEGALSFAAAALHGLDVPAERIDAEITAERAAMLGARSTTS
jgi:CPA2 family monovalent cation:H+ antiporter-2